MIYAAIEEDVPDGAVKIGFSGGDPCIQTALTRLNAMQSSTPHPLAIVAMAIGWESDEHALHVAFSEWHIRGEWFSQSLPVRAWIDAHGVPRIRSTAGRTRPGERWKSSGRPPVMHLAWPEQGSYYCLSQFSTRSPGTRDVREFLVYERPCSGCRHMHMLYGRDAA